MPTKAARDRVKTRTLALGKIVSGGKARARGRRRSMRVLSLEEAGTAKSDRKIRSMNTALLEIDRRGRQAPMTPNQRCRQHAHSVMAARHLLLGAAGSQHRASSQTETPTSPLSPVHVVSKTRTLVSVSDQHTKDNRGRERVNKYVKTLSGSDVFRDLSRKSLEAIVMKLSLTEFVPGEFLMRQGSYGDSLFLIESGKVQITRKEPGADEPEKKLKTLGPPALIGEIALLTAGQRTASVYAISKVRALVMTRDTFEQLQKEGLVEDLVTKASKENERAIDTETLARCSLFHSLSLASRDRMLSVMGRVTFQDGEIIIKEGDTAKHFYVIVRGHVRVSIADEGEIGGQRQVCMFSSFDYFGDTGLVHKSPRTASCYSVGVTRVLSLHRLNFEVLMPPDILKLIEGRGTLARIGMVLKEQQAIEKGSSNSRFMSDFSRRQNLKSTLAEIRTTVSNDFRASRKRVQHGAQRLRNTVRTMCAHDAAYDFAIVPGSKTAKLIGGIFDSHKHQKKRVLKTSIARAQQMFQRILDTPPEHRSKSDIDFLLDCIDVAKAFTVVRRGLDKTSMRKLFRRARMFEFQAMEYLFRQGTTTEHSAFMLLSGVVRIIKHTSQGIELVAIL
jgi:CRP-like cAMP-binding protein